MAVVPEIVTDSSPDIRDVYFQLQNEQRAHAGLQPLHWRDDLAAVAGSRVNDMIVRGYFSHTTPDGQTGYVQSLTAAGLWVAPLSLAGENLAETNAVGAAELALYEMGKWMASPDHRSNILEPGFSACGFGVGQTSQGVYLSCCIFVGGLS